MDESVYQEVYGILILAGHFNLAARLYEQKLFHKAAKKALDEIVLDSIEDSKIKEFQISNKKIIDIKSWAKK